MKPYTTEWFYEQLVSLADPAGNIELAQAELCELVGVSSATFWKYTTLLKEKGLLHKQSGVRGLRVEMPKNVQEVKQEDAAAEAPPPVMRPRPELPDGAMTREEIEQVFFPKEAPIIAEINRLRLKQYEEEQRMRSLEEELRDMERQRDKCELDYKRLLNKELKKALVENSEN